MEMVDGIDDAYLARSAVIDVRTPSEFAEDHIPGAVNLPVLTDAQRAEVGTVYVQESKFKARRIGAAHIARNVANHLETALKDQPGAYAPLIYCWRGGQRSHAMATILAEVGWRVAVLRGGYRTYRRHVTRRLYEETPGLRLTLLDGGTGTAKTEILKHLGALGVQTLDLEALAGHRGSVFGAVGSAQPSQKLFESRLLHEMEGLDLAQPIVVEAEASRIGDRTLPPALWAAMGEAPRIELQAAPNERVRYLLCAYGDLMRDTALMAAALDRLPKRHGPARLEAWRKMAAKGGFERLAAELIAEHYDPAYRGASRRDRRERLGGGRHSGRRRHPRRRR